MITFSVVLSLIGSQMLYGCHIPDVNYYDYRPSYEKYGGFRIYADNPTIDLGHVGFKLEICDESSAFICAYGTGFSFAVPKDPLLWSEEWYYKDSGYRPVEVFDRKMEGQTFKFVVFEMVGFQGRTISYPRQRFVYSRELGLTTHLMVDVPRKTPQGTHVKSPLIYNVFEAVGPAFGRICSNGDNEKD